MKQSDLIKWFSRRYKRLWLIAIFALLISSLSFFLARTSFLEDIENRTMDYRFRLSPVPERADSSIVMIAIDDGSLKFISRELMQGWPFPREYYKVVCDYLTAQGAKTVIFDMFFDEPDFDRIEVSGYESDAEFASAMLDGDNVILGMLLSKEKTELDPTLVRHALGHGTTTKIERDKLKGEVYTGHGLNRRKIVLEPSKWEGSQSPLAMFNEAARGVGAVNLLEGKDSTIRKAPMLFNYGGEIYPSLALSAFLNKQDSISAGTVQKLPLNRNGELYLNWYGEGGAGKTFTYLPFQDLLKSAVANMRGTEPVIRDGYFEGKYIIIGATAGGLMDLKTSPYTWGMPGMEVWATALSNILGNDHIKFLPNILAFLIFFLIGFLVILQVSKFNSGFSTFGILLLLLILLGTAYFTFAGSRIVIPVAGPFLNLLLSWLFVLTLSYVMEGKHKRDLRLMFNRYLHPDLVNRIVDNPDLVQMGGDEFQATVMFSDIYDFTGFSEKHTPTELVSYLNEYFSEFTNSILDNNGLLDKYTGDGLMAVFGVPIANTNHALNACKAALAHRDYSLAFKGKADISSAQHFHLNTRLGIHSGTLVAGNIGSERRMEYTSIGDTVNLSARLEAVNKIFKTYIIISNATYEMVKDQMLCRELDFLTVKGKKEPTRIFELVADKAKADTAQFGWILEYERALTEYRSGNWDAALAIFNKLADKPLEDQASKTLAKRCIYLKSNPPEGWNGMWVLEEK